MYSFIKNTNFLDKFKATVYRHTMFAEFEYIIDKKYESGEVLTSEVLCDTYYDSSSLFL